MMSWTTTSPQPAIEEASREPAVHPYAESDSLQLDAYVGSDDSAAYDFDDETPTSFVPDVAFDRMDDNGNQQMWSMFDTKIDHAGTGHASLSEFPSKEPPCGGVRSLDASPRGDPLRLCRCRW